MNKLFLLDAYALIYRSYYAFIKNPRINSKGLNTSAIVGFVNTLQEVLTKEQPTHIGVAFDPHGPTFRSEAFPEYKAQREATPEDIRKSVPIIKDLLRAWNISILEVDGYEADDVIGTLATKAGELGVDTYMLTPDKDYGQLVTEHVHIYRPRHGGGYEVMGPEEVKAKYNIPSPTAVIDLLALMGDAADNFPGCPGVGEKTAAKLIGQFGNIDQLLAHTSELKGALKTKVENHVDDIRLSLFLATIKTDVPVELNLDELKVSHPNEEELGRLLEELEFKSLANKILKKSKNTQTSANPQLSLFAEFAPESAESSKFSSFESLKTTPHKYHLVDNEEEMQRICDYFRTVENVSLDTETTSTTAIDAELVGLSFATKEHKAYYVPVPADRAEAQKVVEIFRPIYESDKIVKVGQNLKYDLEVLRNYDIHLQGPMFDTMIAHYLLHPEMRHGMDYLAEAYLNYQTIHIEELIGTGKKQISMAQVPPQDVCPYAAEDADITLRLKHLFQSQMEEAGCLPLFQDLEMPLMPVLAQMERNGVCIDSKGLRDTSVHYSEEMALMEQEIHKMAGLEFNVSSPRQVGEVLFDRLQLSSKAKKTKKGQYTTSEEVLEGLRSKHPIVEKILQYRGLKKLLSTYIDALPQLVNPRTGHIHTSFNQTVAATGRLSSSNPNLQNIPVRDALGKEVRKAFVPDEGELFFSADYSQIELRIMAHLSQDANLIEAFSHGDDIHAATAAKIFHKDIQDVTSDERRKAKTANFGIIYGISAFGLAERMGVSRTEAKQLIDGYFATYPGVRQYMTHSIEMAREKGYTQTLCQRRCYLPDINSNNAVVRGYAERNAINAPIQGSAADIIKRAMIRIQKRLQTEGMRSKMILQVHDELNFSVPPEEKEHLQALVIEEMQGAYELRVPLVADCGWGTNWLEAH